jgi:hypothetical protein
MIGPFVNSSNVRHRVALLGRLVGFISADRPVRKRAGSRAAVPD